MQETEASSVIYTQGCIDSLTLWINDHLHIVGGLAFGFALIQVRSDLVILFVSEGYLDVVNFSFFYTSYLEFLGPST